MKKIIFKILVLASTAYAVICMLHWPLGFTYFTQLSNIYAAVVVGAQLYAERRRGEAGYDAAAGADHSAELNNSAGDICGGDIRSGDIRGGDIRDSSFLHTLKYTAVLSVTITFLVFFGALSRIQPGGMLAAYLQDKGASMCMHLITPVLMNLDFYINDVKSGYSRPHVLYGMIPPLIYLIFIAVLSFSGLRWGHGTMNAPYPFLNTLAPSGWFGLMPETAGFTTFGIGVFYTIPVLALLVYILSLLQYKMAAKVFHR